jgi:hypothetical protein
MRTYVHDQPMFSKNQSFRTKCFRQTNLFEQNVFRQTNLFEQKNFRQTNIFEQKCFRQTNFRTKPVTLLFNILPTTKCHRKDGRLLGKISKLFFFLAHHLSNSSCFVFKHVSVHENAVKNAVHSKLLCFCS